MDEDRVLDLGIELTNMNDEYQKVIFKLIEKVDLVKNDWRREKLKKTV